MPAAMALFFVLPLLFLIILGGLLFRLALRALAAAGLAGVAGVVLSLLLGQGPGVAVLLAVLLFMPMLLLLGRGRRGRRNRSVEAPRTVSESSSWEALRRAAPHAKRPLLEAERRCADFLLLAEAQSYQPETAELQVLIERRVPELISHGLARCQAASPGERRQVLDETVASVTEVAAAAEAQRAALWRASGDGFAAQRAHLADRLRPGPLSSV